MAKDPRELLPAASAAKVKQQLRQVMVQTYHAAAQACEAEFSNRFDLEEATLARI